MVYNNMRTKLPLVVGRAAECCRSIGVPVNVQEPPEDLCCPRGTLLSQRPNEKCDPIEQIQHSPQCPVLY